MNTELVMHQLKPYVFEFSHLIQVKNTKVWDSKTNFTPPHKSFLLFSVLDLYDQGIIKGRNVELIPELADRFGKYWNSILPERPLGKIILPFFHLHTSNFWTLIPMPGKNDELAKLREVSSLSQFRNIILCAKLDDSLVDLLKDPKSSRILRATLMNSNFNQSCFRQLMEVSKPSFSFFEEDLEIAKKLK